MNTLRTASFTLAGLALASVANAQTFETIATESFDYADLSGIDGQVGGFGWFQQWYAGGAGYVTVPGLDAAGGAALTDGNNVGAYRSPKTGPWTQTVAPGFNFGADSGYSMWVSFTAQRAPGSDSQYGGLSLHTSFVGEKLFIGSPFASGEWGLAVPGCCDFRVTGSDVTVPTRIVVKIDYLVGDERVQLWLDPGVDHPTTTADLDIIATNHDWNEIRLQSGEGPTANGWLWDDIVIECEDCTPPDLVTDVDAISVATGGAQTMTLYAGQENEGDLYILVGSLSGTSPGIPIGPGVLPLNLDAYLNATLSAPAGVGLTNSSNFLNGDGSENATLTVPAGLGVLAGLTANHAYVVLDLGTFGISKVSSAASLTFNP
ncbi:hypothetical protein [Engelhardtia mirabilis]|uniref:Uncharacterized protein n=1 Tax=Engelhardtia mirabilis TaxID=2528011 RepID=A0A518BLN6_9BACT|nr:hypothetical protein Pla133_29740 [Planctomycetes bacterium Pla133]QDV02211.1 hypothetical protein Pla86_29730 [Planctomycetes bacterium Pla86]